LQPVVGKLKRMVAGAHPAPDCLKTVPDCLDTVHDCLKTVPDCLMCEPCYRKEKEAALKPAVGKLKRMVVGADSVPDCLKTVPDCRKTVHDCIKTVPDCLMCEIFCRREKEAALQPAVGKLKRMVAIQVDGSLGGQRSRKRTR